VGTPYICTGAELFAPLHGKSRPGAESQACWQNGVVAEGDCKSRGSLRRQVVSVGVPFWTDNCTKSDIPSLHRDALRCAGIPRSATLLFDGQE
jgi:hypothetical protein